MLRRNALLGLMGTPLLGLAREPVRGLEITGLEVFRVRVNKRGNWTVPRLRTSGGVTGIGDASQSGNDDETLRYLQQFSELLRGRDVFGIEQYRGATANAVAAGGQHAAVAASALEHCLWDIRGKAFGVPVYQFFGGKVRDETRQYANINRSTQPRTPEGFARMAERAVRDGFDAVKLAPFDEMPRGLRDEAEIEEFTARGLACAEAVRGVLGKGRDLLIDAHSHFDRAHGLELARRFELLDLFWLEEVTPAKPVDDLAAINAAAKMPTAGGESIRGVKGFYPYVRAQAVDIVMPDVKVCGGMLELKKIAALAEGAGLLVSPHGPASPVGNVVAAHVAATLPNFNILEFSYGEVPWRAELIEPAEQIIGGRLRLTDQPGFGIELNERIAKRYEV